jgi:hypothetical protein
MKIISVDNFGRDYKPDKLIAENVNKRLGQIMVDALNDKLSGNEAQDHYRLVPDDHKLLEIQP